MELAELSRRLVPFVRAMYEAPSAEVDEVHKMPGHAGFAYGFTAVVGERREPWFLRLPPPGVQWRGTADVLRQAVVLRALAGTAVPHCPVQWAGDDLQWFGCPYFVVPQLDGDVIRLEEGGWTRALPEATRRDMARQAMQALADLHALDWRLAAKLGEPMPFTEDVTRWDRFVEKAAEPQRLEHVPEVRRRLLERLPEDVPVGIFHGDFQWANLFYSSAGRLLAVIDWELVGIGATLNDVGWIATFNDPQAWRDSRRPAGVMPLADELVEMYREACARPLPDLDWFRALAAYKFAIISGFNLSLHRRGKRPDPTWEETALSIRPLLERALTLLG